MKKFILSAIIGLLGLSASAQTVVRSLDDSSTSTAVAAPSKPQASSTNSSTSTSNPQPKDSKISTNTTTQLRHSYGGIGVSYSYNFGVLDGKTNKDNGMSLCRIPIYYNHIFGEHKSGVYGSIAYAFGSKETKYGSDKYKTTLHYIPMQLHYSWNLRFAPTHRGQEHGLIFHAGPGLNVLAGGNIKHYEYVKGNSKASGWKKMSSCDSDCDFTLGFGIGYRIDVLLFHFGFNGAVTTPKGSDAHNCDFDLSFQFAF